MMQDKWGWYNTLYILANEQFIRIDDITKMNLRECLTFMCYKQDINEIEKQQLQQEYARINKI